MEAFPMNPDSANNLATGLDSFNHLIMGQSLPLPLMQSLLMLAVVTACLILGRFKLGLLIAYGFLFLWGFIGNRLIFFDMFGSFGMLFFVFAGLSMSIAWCLGFFQENH
jgi:hypothetical protein